MSPPKVGGAPSLLERAPSELDPYVHYAALGQKANQLRTACTALSFDELREWLGQQRRALERMGVVKRVRPST
jgi:hypothetical protein